MSKCCAWQSHLILYEMEFRSNYKGSLRETGWPFTKFGDHPSPVFVRESAVGCSQ